MSQTSYADADRLARNFITRYGANIGGGFYLGGNVAQFSMGAFNGDPIAAAAGTVLLATSATLTYGGRNDKAFAAACVMGATGSVLATHHLVFVQQDPSATIGLALLLASSAAGMASAPLARQFSQAKKALLRRTLGAPRQVMAGLSFLAKAPLLWSAARHGNWGQFSVFATWAAGDVFMGLSRPRGAAAAGPAEAITPR